MRLLDLGVAWLKDELVRLSRTGEFVGSFFYAAPEQFGPEFGPLDERADLFALGVTLFEMATGYLPWEEEDASIAPAARGGLAPPRLTDVLEGISPS